MCFTCISALYSSIMSTTLHGGGISPLLLVLDSVDFSTTLECNICDVMAKVQCMKTYYSSPDIRRKNDH